MLDSTYTAIAISGADAFLICDWMEPYPTNAPEYWANNHEPAIGGWWVAIKLNAGINAWIARPLTLAALWDVEARLTEEQWTRYATLMMDPAGVKHTRFLLHATAEQKVKALATVIRVSRGESDAAV
jgi:hypothetical protein